MTKTFCKDSRTFVIILGLAAPAPARAAGGATSADFLGIDVGARPAALGGAFTGLAEGADAIAYNPAGLARLPRAEASFMHDQYVSGVHQEWLAAALPTQALGTFALSANVLSVSPFASYDPNDQPAGTVSAMDSAYELAYARELGWGVSAGLGAQVIASRLADKRATAEALDAGLHWRLWPGLDAGASVLRLGKSMSYEGGASPLPRAFRAGLAWHPDFFRGDELEESRWVFDHLAVTADAISTQGQKTAGAFGAEIAYLGLSLRAGGRAGDVPAGPGYTLGGGVALFRGAEEDFPEIDFDYAFVDQGQLGLAHRAELTVKFGAKRGSEAAPERAPGKRKAREWSQEKFDPIQFGPTVQ